MGNVLIDIRENNFLKGQFKDKDFVSLEDIISKYEDKVYDVERLEEELQDIRNSNEAEEYNNYIEDVRNGERDLYE